MKLFKKTKKKLPSCLVDSCWSLQSAFMAASRNIVTVGRLTREHLDNFKFNQGRMFTSQLNCHIQIFIFIFCRYATRLVPCQRNSCNLVQISPRPLSYADRNRMVEGSSEHVRVKGQMESLCLMTSFAAVSVNRGASSRFSKMFPTCSSASLL